MFEAADTNSLYKNPKLYHKNKHFGIKSYVKIIDAKDIKNDFAEDNNLFENIKDLLVSNDVKIFDENIKGGSGYLIRKGIIYISSESPLTIQHELAHIAMINNFDKLLIDNWGYPLLNTNIPRQAHKFLLMESRVLGVENFISGKMIRHPNENWLAACIYPVDDIQSSHLKAKKQTEEYQKIKNQCEGIVKRYFEEMTNDKILHLLNDRFTFISDYIKKHSGFNSKKFDLD